MRTRTCNVCMCSVFLQDAARTARNGILQKGSRLAPFQPQHSGPAVPRRLRGHLSHPSTSGLRSLELLQGGRKVAVIAGVRTEGCGKERERS